MNCLQIKITIGILEEGASKNLQKRTGMFAFFFKIKHK